MYFFGLDTSYHFIDSAEMPSNGTIDPVFVPDPRRPNRYKLVARQIGAPDLPTVSLIFHEQWGGIPRALMAPKCEFNLYEVHSRCADLSDFYRGWDSYVLIYSGFRFESGIDLGTRTAADSDEGLTANIDAKGAAIYPVGALGFGEEAASSVTTEVIDVVYGTSITCGDCGVENDGSKFIYAVCKKTTLASSSDNLKVVYSIDGGLNWTYSIVDDVANLSPVFIDIAGNTLFVGVQSGSPLADTKIYYQAIEPITGSINNAKTDWSSVTLSSVLLTDVWVKSARSIWFSSSTSGGIYKTADVTTAPSLIDNGAGDTLKRIAGANDTIVAVGGVTGTSGKVRYSKNGGATWTSLNDSVLDGSGSSIDDWLTAVAVLDDRTWYVGSADGFVVYTKTGGVTWSKLTLPNEGSTSYAISDVVFPTREVGWITQNDSAASPNVGNLFTTIDGGNTVVKHDATSRIQNYPSTMTIRAVNRIGVPFLAEPAVAANYITLGGLSAASDGILVSAAPTIV
jgi:hypothetical protein